MTGRFTTRDTVFGSLSDPQSQNRYVYCRNNPQKYVDPDGEWAVPILVGGAIGGTINFYKYSNANPEWMATKEGQRGMAVAITKGVIKGGVSSISVAGAGLLLTATIKLTAVASAEIFEYGANTAMGLETEETAWSDMGSNWLVDAGVSTALSTISPFSEINSVGNAGFDQVMRQAPNKILGALLKPTIKEGARNTLSNASEYDPWREDYYMIQPMIAIYDWDQIESNR